MLLELGAIQSASQPGVIQLVTKHFSYKYTHLVIVIQGLDDLADQMYVLRQVILV